MKWETPEALLESAKKYADDFDDKAVKSNGHEDYKYNKELADLLKAMSVNLKYLEEIVHSL